MNTVRDSYPIILRSTYQQTTTGLLWQPPSWKHRTIGTNRVVSDFTSQEGIRLHKFELTNRAAASINLGIGFRIANRFWIGGAWTTAAFVIDTTDYQDAGTSDFILEAAATNDDGFVIACPFKFDWVSLKVGTAGVDGAGAADHAVTYSNVAGTGWTALGSSATFTDQFTTTNTTYSTGALEFVWSPPMDWGKVTSLSVIPAGYYALKIAATTAVDTTAALGSVCEIGVMPFVQEGLADNGIYSGEVNYTCHEADALVAYFSTAAAGNQVYAECETA